MAPIIDDLYTEVVKRLQADGSMVSISKKFSTLKANSERTRYVYDIIKKLELLPRNVIVSKSQALSDKYREMGNQCYKNNYNYHALQFYNLSVAHAPYNSDQMSLAVSNRSAVLCSLERYDECIQDIDTVFALGHPEKIREKLTTRKKTCIERKAKVIPQDNVSINTVLQMPKARHPEIPCASNKIKLEYDEAMGHQVVLTEDVEVGEFLAEEEPYTQYLLKTKAMLCCSYCFSESANLMPCDTCCIVLYCGQECKDKANKEYHRFECSIGWTLAEMDFTKLELLALRVVIKARCERSSWEDLFGLTDALDTQTPSARDGMISDGSKWIFDSKNYETIHTLSTNENCRNVSDIFQKATSAAVLQHLLSLTSFILLEDAQVDNIGGLLLRQLMISPTNYHAVSSTIYERDGTCVSSTEMGSAAYGLLSYLNHSCAPNVVRFNKKGSTTTTLISLRRMKKGQQLFDNYGYHHALLPKTERQTSLKFQYKFVCSCEACVNDWPKYTELTEKRLPLGLLQMKDRIIAPDTIESLKYGKLETAKSMFRGLCKLAQALEDYIPCSEIGEVQEALKQCAFIMEGVLPEGYSLYIDWIGVISKNMN